MRLLKLAIIGGLVFSLACQEKEFDTGPQADSRDSSVGKPIAEVEKGKEKEADKGRAEETRNDAAEQTMEKNLRAKLPVGTLFAKAAAKTIHEITRINTKTLDAFSCHFVLFRGR